MFPGCNWLIRGPWSSAGPLLISPALCGNALPEAKPSLKSPGTLGQLRTKDERTSTMDELNEFFKTMMFWRSKTPRSPESRETTRGLHSFSLHLHGMQCTQVQRAECTLDTCCTSKMGMRMDAQGTWRHCGFNMFQSYWSEVPNTATQNLDARKFILQRFSNYTANGLSKDVTSNLASTDNSSPINMAPQQDQQLQLYTPSSDDPFFEDMFDVKMQALAVDSLSLSVRKSADFFPAAWY